MLDNKIKYLKRIATTGDIDKTGGKVAEITFAVTR
jgi:hypothetical protein